MLHTFLMSVCMHLLVVYMYLLHLLHYNKVRKTTLEADRENVRYVLCAKGFKVFWGESPVSIKNW